METTLEGVQAQLADIEARLARLERGEPPYPIAHGMTVALLKIAAAVAAKHASGATGE